MTLSNLINIARKEFTDLASNRYIIIILIVYIIMFICSYRYTGTLIRPGAIVASLLEGWNNIMVTYSCIVATVIGFVSISNEKKDNALHTLLVKPLYRDTIINGKLIGALSFLSCIIGFIVAIYISFEFVFWGSEISQYLLIYLEWIPVIFILSVVCATIFLLLSMLFSLMVREQSFALFSSIFVCLVLVWYIPSIGQGNDFTMIFGASGANQGAIANIILNISPLGVINQIIYHINDAVSPLAIVSTYYSEIITLLVYIVILAFFNYIIFMRRDVI